ncbi:acetyl-CoA carboxylase biotin carboxylase subunit, partial [Gammaproteobacteria bacterium]|nr:acetyl-CoA carboxylase biotin carboxylase subunit [Gammaproteobacteria bacterium]
RHIEVQVIGDGKGNAIHLGERDCSIQRRHQKIIEEAPAPGITPEQRKQIGERCAKACKNMKYRGAGTFEFLYEKNEFYFIEMNTRVQVEHPITEMITGFDIVKEQLKIASGEKLSATQADIKIRGHAIECRINAEDSKTFTPCPGTINHFHAPGGPGVRLDSHLYSSYTVPPFYDSLIAKIITHGDTREIALTRMRGALDEMIVDGIKTNLPLHLEILRTGDFQKGMVNIHYLEQWLNL